jgi:hypothetical protein
MTTMTSEQHSADTQKLVDLPLEMTEDERYLFDLNGYLVVRNVLSLEEVREINAVIDARADNMVARSAPVLKNALPGTKLSGPSGTARRDLGQVLEWGPDSKLFKSILAHPRLVPLFHGILGKVSIRKPQGLYVSLSRLVRLTLVWDICRSFSGIPNGSFAAGDCIE